MPSWERGASVGNLIATIREVALDPVRTFANLREGGYARPISFTYWSLLPAWLCGSLLYGALFGFMAAGAANLPGGDNDPFAAWIAGVGPLVAALAISAGLAVVFLFVPLFNFVGAAERRPGARRRPSGHTLAPGEVGGMEASGGKPGQDLLRGEDPELLLLTSDVDLHVLFDRRDRGPRKPRPAQPIGRKKGQTARAMKATATQPAPKPATAKAKTDFHADSRWATGRATDK